jgi:hypothetical protein
VTPAVSVELDELDVVAPFWLDRPDGEVAEIARAGAMRSKLAEEVTVELLSKLCAIGSREEIGTRLAAYGAAGANRVGIVPATAEDPAGQRVLAALSPSAPQLRAA